MLRHLLAVYTSDREDGGWLGASFTIPLPHKLVTYADMFPLIKGKLATPEIITLITEEDLPSEDDFIDADTGELLDIKFHSVHYRNYGIEYDFEFPDGDMVTIHKEMDDIVLYDDY